jgi:outer membrane autotransporter protein
LVDIQGGILCGAGTVTAGVRNNGEVDPGGVGVAGRLTINGDYTQTAAGVLNIEVGGPNAGTDYDQLVVTGQATLAGTLNVTLINGYVPAHGAPFQVMTFAGRGGTTFDTANVDPSLMPPAYNATNVTVVAR